MVILIALNFLKIEFLIMINPIAVAMPLELIMSLNFSILIIVNTYNAELV